ncbi:MAG: maleylpyruvate isomerase N-terminal domain-containing protein [Acidimicrobiales bacterium]
MQTTASPSVDWAAAQAAVSRACPRVTALLRSVRNPDAPAIGTWTLTDLTVHVSHVMDAVTAAAKGGGGLVDDVWALTDVTDMFVKAETERSLPALADRIDASVAGLLDFMGAAPGDTAKTWLVKGVDVPLSLLTCHVLNELVMHGRDIALADGQPWPIDRSTATLILEGFVLPVLSGLGRSMVVEDAARNKRITYDVRLRGGGRHQFHFDNGDFSIHPGPPTRPVDVHLSVDAEAFLLVSWNRISQWSAIPKGKLLAWGRKPWLGLKLRGLLKNP